MNKAGMRDAASREARLARLQLELGERSGRILLPKGAKTPSTWSLDSWLQNHETAGFCCLLHPSLPA